MPGAIHRGDTRFEIANEVGIEQCVFEAVDPPVFKWYIKNLGSNVTMNKADCILIALSHQ